MLNIRIPPSWFANPSPLWGGRLGLRPSGVGVVRLSIILRKLLRTSERRHCATPTPHGFAVSPSPQGGGGPHASRASVPSAIVKLTNDPHSSRRRPSTRA